MRQSMIGKALGCVIACAVTYGAHGALAQQQASAQDSPLRTLVTRFHNMPKCQKAGISFGTIAGTASSWDSVGEVNKTGEQPHAIREDDVFEIGSITKTFTALLYALAQERSTPVVGAGSPAQPYMPAGFTLPNRAPNGRTVAIKLDDLARHASGLRSNLPTQNGALTVGLMLRETVTYPLKFAPGSHFFYSNLGFAILGLAMEKLFNAPIETLLRDQVAVPLGMRSTVVAGTDFSGVLVGYNADDGMPARRGKDTWPAFNGAGALLSTPKDMQVYLQFHMGLIADNPANSQLNLARRIMLRAFRLPNFPRGRKHTVVGLAWQRLALPCGRQYFWKDGKVPGFRSYIAFTKEGRSLQQAGVVILTNQDGCQVEHLGRCVLENILGTRPQDRYCANPGVAAEAEPGESAE